MVSFCRGRTASLPCCSPFTSLTDFCYNWRNLKPADLTRHFKAILWIALDAVIIFCLVKSYEYVRNNLGSSAYPPEAALHNAELLISFEKLLGLFWEQHIQQVFLPYHWFIEFWNNYYASVHGIATFGTLIIIAVLKNNVYHRVKLPFVLMNVFALIGYATYPLMPPRLLNDCETLYGGCATEYSFVDTMYTYGGIWSYRSETVNEHTNHYAAMPSMHLGWSSWVAWALWSMTGYKVFFCYPAMTFFAVVVTANHYIMDGVVGICCLIVAINIVDVVVERHKRYIKVKEYQKVSVDVEMVDQNSMLLLPPV